MQLEPLTRRSLAKYVIAESPVDATGVADIVAEATTSAGAIRPNHVGVLYGLLAVVFTRPDALDHPTPGDAWLAILQTIRTLAYKQDPDPSHWHLPDDAFHAESTARQAPDEEWSPSRAIRVFTAGDRDAALHAIRDISVQGEGPAQPSDDPLGSHFERFLHAYRGDAGVLPFPANAESVPALDVPTNPVLDGAPGDASVIQDPKAKAVAVLADLRYALLLGFLGGCLPDRCRAAGVPASSGASRRWGRFATCPRSSRPCRATPRRGRWRRCRSHCRTSCRWLP